jgi:hypothetical protein
MFSDFAAKNNRVEIVEAEGVGIKNPLLGPGADFIGISISILPDAPVQKDHCTNARNPVQYENSTFGTLSTMSTVDDVILF